MSFTTVSTSVVLVPTVTSNSPFFVYLNNVSTAGRIVTVRDNDGYASSTNRIVVAPANGAYFQDGTSSITINQPYGYLTFTTALDGGYGVLNTFGFPSGSAAAFVSNITSVNLNTSSITTTNLTGVIANFTTMNINTISTGNILIQSFTPSSIVTHSVSTGTIQGGSLSFGTINGTTIQTNNLRIPSLSTATGQFGNVTTTFSTVTSTLTFSSGVRIIGNGSQVSIGSNTLGGSSGVAIGTSAQSGSNSIAIGTSAGSQGIQSIAIGQQAGGTTQGQVTVAVGRWAGLNNQGDGAVAVGEFSGGQNQGEHSVAIGRTAGSSAQGIYSVAAGFRAAFQNQGSQAVAIGLQAGSNTQGSQAIAIGSSAGLTLQGANSIAIGAAAGQTNQSTNTIVLNATGSVLDTTRSSALFIAPIRNDQTGVGTRVAVYYDQVTKEMTTGPATGTNLTVSTIITSTIQTNTIQIAGSLVANTIQTNQISTTNIIGTGLSNLSISTGSIIANSIQANTLSTASLSLLVGNIGTVNTNSLSTSALSVGSLNVTTLSTGSILLGSASIGSIATNTISTGIVTANSGTISTFQAGSIVANAGQIGSLQTNTLSTTTLSINGLTTMVNRRTRTLFVANGNSGDDDLKYSFNGQTWFNGVTNTTFSGFGTGVAWNESYFVATGSDTAVLKTIRTSTDGSNWMDIQSGGFIGGGCNVAWNGRQWICVGSNNSTQGHIQYSTNGSNWFLANTTTFSGFATGVAWGNGLWIVAGRDSSGPANSLLISSNGSNWSFASNPTSCSSITVAYNGSIWLAGGFGARPTESIIFSSNGSNWAPIQSGGFVSGCFSLGWNGMMWVAGGSNGLNNLQYSYNGMNWFHAISGSPNQIGNAITWNGSLWVAGGKDIISNTNNIKTSQDGLNWSSTSGVPYSDSVLGIAFTNTGADLVTQEMNLFSQNVPNVLQSTNQILALTSSLVLNNTVTVNRGTHFVGINASVPQAPLHVVGGLNGQTSQIMLQTLGSTLNTSLYLSTNVGQAILGVVGPSNGWMTHTVPGDTILTTAQTTNRLVMGNGTQIGLFISSGTVVIPGALAIGASISTASLTTGSASFSNIVVASSTLVSTLFFTGDVSIQGATDKIQLGSNAGVTGQGRGAVALGAAAGQTSQGASGIAIGSNAGQTSQGSSGIAIGSHAGQTLQGAAGIAFGQGAGQTSQSMAGIAIGSNAGQTTQGSAGIAFGQGAGQTSQGARSIAIGSNAGSNIQGIDAIAIGSAAGGGFQGTNAIAIGASAGQTSQHANTIILNASGTALQSATTNALYINPIRNDQGGTGERFLAYYNQITKEITTGPTTNLAFSSLTVTGSVAFPSVSTNTLSTTTVNAATMNAATMNAATVNTTTISTTNIQAIQVSSLVVFASTIGIHNTNPQTALDIVGGVRILANGSTSNFGVGFDTLSLKSTSNNFQGGTTSISFYNNSDQIFGRIYGIDVGTSPNPRGDLVFQTAGPTNTERMRIQYNGNVGIGNSSPSTILHVQGNPVNTAGATQFMITGTGVIPNTAMIIQNSFGSAYFGIAGSNTQYFTNTLAGDTIIRTGDSATTRKLMIGNAGASPGFTLSNNLVGINTTNPGHPLQVNGTTWLQSTVYIGASLTGNEIRFHGTTNDGPPSFSFTHTVISDRIYEAGTEKSELVLFKGNDTLSGPGPDRVRVLASGGFQVDCGGAMIWTQGGAPPVATYSNALVVSGSNGFVGINNPNPQYALDVIGAINTSGSVLISSIGNNNPFIKIATGTTDGFIGNFVQGESGPCFSVNYFFDINTNIATIPNSGRATGMIKLAGVLSGIQFYTGNTNQVPIERMRINPSGNIGIGFTSPAFKLDVNGDTHVVGNIEMEGNGYLRMTPSAGDVYIQAGSNSSVNSFTKINFSRIKTTETTMTVDTGNKRVGIGATFPIAPLEIIGLNSNNISLLVSGGVTNTNTSFVLSNVTGAFCQIGLAQAAGSYNTNSLPGDTIFRNYDVSKKYIFTNGTAGLGLVLSNNCVGIGKVPTTGFQLDLSTGDARKLSGASWATGSDERIKKNVILADTYICYSTIKAIPLKYYEWNVFDPVTLTKIPTDEKHELGFIAQEVEKVFPHAVKQSQDYGYSNFRTLNVDQLLKMHYGATQHTMKVIEEQSTMIQTLTTQVEELQQSVSTLMGR